MTGGVQAIIVCPSTLVGDWGAELHKWIPSHSSRHTMVLSSSKDPKEAKGQVTKHPHRAVEMSVLLK